MYGGIKGSGGGYIPSGGIIGFRNTTSMTKRETMMLPKFSGDEDTAYLKYPIRRKQWMLHITDYEEEYRSTMLLNLLDRLAAERAAGSKKIGIHS